MTDRSAPPFTPFADPDVQHALGALVTQVTAYALRLGVTPLCLAVQAAAASENHLLSDVAICGDCGPSLAADLADNLIDVADSEDEAQMMTLPHPH